MWGEGGRPLQSPSGLVVGTDKDAPSFRGVLLDAAERGLDGTTPGSLSPRTPCIFMVYTWASKGLPHHSLQPMRIPWSYMEPWGMKGPKLTVLHA